MDICIHKDDYVPELHWQVDLDSGITVYQDDDRPGVVPGSAWLRLKEYCLVSGCKIVGMRLHFRSNAVSIPSNADGYFFIKGAALNLFENDTTHTYITGIWNPHTQLIATMKWRVPELLPIEAGERTIERAAGCLITNG